MTTLRKYLFDVDFGARPSAAKAAEAQAEALALADEPEEELPPTFTEEELALAREQALEAGRRAGVQEAEAGTERLVANALAAIGNQLKGLANAQQAANDERLKQSVAVAVTVMRKLHPEMSRRGSLDEIAAVVRDCLSQIDEDVRVTIRVNPAHIDHIREHAERSAASVSFDGKMIFTADQRLAPGDCRVEWGDGGAERDQARIWAEIDRLVARASGAEPGDEPAPSLSPAATA
jgi:flagellar assembly protein FliH